MATAATYPGPNPKVQFDHIVTDTASLASVAAGRSIAMTISDHRALVADVEHKPETRFTASGG